MKLGFSGSFSSLSRTVSLGSCLLLVASATLGCQTEAAKKCDSLVKVSLASLSTMNSADIASVEGTKAGLNDALGACEKARRTAEVKDIQDALGNVGTHLKRLLDAKKKADSVPKPQERSPEDWEKIEKDGDPQCPSGMAYQRPDKKEPLISCTGPTLLERGWVKTSEHFASHRYQLMTKGADLRAVRGSSEFIYTFEKADSEKAALCIKMRVAPGKKWEPLVAVATNVPVKTIEKGKAVEAKGREVSFTLIENGDVVEWVHLGVCDGRSEPTPDDGAKAETKEESPASPAQK